MAPAPPPGDAVSGAASIPENDDRTRRNVACVNCRNSKVRCRTSLVPGQPCQRCARLHISCVVDKAHKRVTRRSKLEQLEQELRSIKQVVNPRANSQESWTPPSPRATFSALPDQPPPPPPPPQVPPTPRAEAPIGSLGPSTQGSQRRAKPALPEHRMLGNHAVSGEDVEWYFGKFLQCYHPLMPVLRKKNPDECYEANPTLFWVVLYVACRRYPRDRAIFSALIDHVGRDVWVMMSAPAMNLEAIHALVLLLCTWPLPNIRFVTDPSSTLAAIAMNAAQLMGCHSGRGSHPRFTIGMRQHFYSTDEEASSTWLACCMLAQRTASSIGIVPPSIQLDDSGPRRALESGGWRDLLAMYEAQRFLNRFHGAMAAQIGANGGVPEPVVAMWEAEFEALMPLLFRYETGRPRPQASLCKHPSSQGPGKTYRASAWLRRSWSCRATTSSARRSAAPRRPRAVIGLSLDLEARSQLLTHAPQWALRSIVDAAAIVVAVLHSSSAPDMAPVDADALVQQACGAVLRCSVRDADLPHRASIIMETFWSVRNLVPPLLLGPEAWPDRLAAGVTYWCLERFRLGLQNAQGSTDKVNKALDLMHPARSAAVQSDCASTSASASAAASNGQEPPAVTLISDPLQDVDWSMFMDDFGWVGGDAVLLGLP